MEMQVNSLEFSAVQAIRLSKIVRGDKRAGNQAPRPPVFRGWKRETMKRYGEREAGRSEENLKGELCQTLSEESF